MSPKTIWKFPLPIEDKTTIEMPTGAQILTVQSQKLFEDWKAEIYIWALVDSHQPMVPRTFCVVGTGHPFEDADSCEYIGTAQIDGGKLGWHVFELRGDADD